MKYKTFIKETKSKVKRSKYWFKTIRSNIKNRKKK